MNTDMSGLVVNLSKREFYAAVALHSMMRDFNVTSTTPEWMAQWVVRVSDAVVQQLEASEGD